jgi:hypothetical protein
MPGEGCTAVNLTLTAKSGKHAYYTCSTYAKRGKKACDMKLLNQNMLESFVVQRIRENILIENNLVQLLNLVQAEIRQHRKDSKSQIEATDKQLNSLRNKQAALYRALESGKLDIDDLAPRIKEIREQIDHLEAQKEHLLLIDTNPPEIKVEMPALKSYVKDLGDLLKTGSIIEQRGFLRSFVKRISVNHPKVTIDYSIPINKEKAEPLVREVLPFSKSGSPILSRN